MIAALSLPHIAVIVVAFLLGVVAGWICRSGAEPEDGQPWM